MRFEALYLFLHVFNFLLEFAHVGSVTILKLRDNVLVALNSTLHLFLKLIKLFFVPASLILLIFDLCSLCIQVVFGELEFKEDVTELVLVVYKLPDILPLGSVLVEYVGRVLRILHNHVALLLVFHEVDNLSVYKIALCSKRPNSKTNKITRFPTESS